MFLHTIQHHDVCSGHKTIHLVQLVIHNQVASICSQHHVVQQSVPCLVIPVVLVVVAIAIADLLVVVQIELQVDALAEQLVDVTIVPVDGQLVGQLALVPQNVFVTAARIVVVAIRNDDLNQLICFRGM